MKQSETFVSVCCKIDFIFVAKASECMEKKEKKVRKIVCPACGKATNVSIIQLDGELRFSLRCRSCKEESEIVLKNIR